jgi:hypothetical protein
LFFTIECGSGGSGGKRILEVSKFDQQDREHIFSVIDAFIAKRKIQSIL